MKVSRDDQLLLILSVLVGAMLIFLATGVAVVPQLIICILIAISVSRCIIARKKRRP